MDDLNAARLDALLRARRTVHDFRPDPVPEDRVRAALDVSRFAPNHHLTEPWRYYLIGPQTAAAIADLNAELVAAKKGQAAAESKRQRWRQIPGWLAITTQTGDDSLRTREDYAACCCAVYAVMLRLWADGIGSKWTTGAVTRDPRLYDLLWIDPDREQLVSLLWYGWPAEIPSTQRRALDRLLIRLP